MLAIVGVLLPFLAAPAIALGLLAMDDVARDRRPHRRARAWRWRASWWGSSALALWALGLILGMLLAQP